MNNDTDKLGATVCIPRGEARCASCPAATICRANREGRQSAYPVCAEKRARRRESRTVLLLWAEDETGHSRLALNRRPPTGLLAGLWELPNVQGDLSADEAMAMAEEWGVSPIALTDTYPRTHIFTHIEWHMTVHTIRCAAAVPPFVWVSDDERNAEYALPSAFQICLK